MIKSYKRLCIFVGVIVAIVLVAIISKISVLMGVALWIGIALLYVLCGKKSILQNTYIESMGVKEYITVSIMCVLTILALTLPMGLSIYNNGTYPYYSIRDQYEVMADSIIDGHLYMDYEVDEKLLEMDNPYDFEARQQLGVEAQWDHAFYNGRYYMYFGVVPVFLLFVPYKLIFGTTLLAYHASQLFSGLSVIAFYALFLLISKRYFPKIAVGTYILIASAVSFISLGFCTQAPALYCTAIISAICMMLWSILFYVWGVLFVKKAWAQVLFATLGAISGALAFGCRPPVAMANLLAIPLAYVYVKNYKGKKLGLIRNFCIILLPYLVIGVLLAYYNYARYGNPLEFGQAYQITVVDQTMYGDFGSRFNIWDEITGIYNNFFGLGTVVMAFPYIDYNGMFVTYPLMTCIPVLLLQPSVRKSLKDSRLVAAVASLGALVIIITAFDIYWAPNIIERYRMDEYFLMGILCFIVVGAYLKASEYSVKASAIFSALAVTSMLVAFILFWREYDLNYAYTGGEAKEICKALFFLKD